MLDADRKRKEGLGNTRRGSKQFTQRWGEGVSKFDGGQGYNVKSGSKKCLRYRAATIFWVVVDEGGGTVDVGVEQKEMEED